MVGPPHPDEWLRIDRVPPACSRALFVDRDGTVIENVPYLNDPSSVCLLPGAIETLLAFREAGYAIIVVSNQSGIARGLCTPDQYRAVEARLQDMLGVAAADLTYSCPFHPGGEGIFASHHPSRKPGAGMLHDAAVRFQIDVPRSVMVGDSLVDIQAGAAGGVGRLVHVATGHGMADAPSVAAFAESAGVGVESLAALGELRPTAQIPGRCQAGRAP